MLDAQYPNAWRRLNEKEIAKLPREAKIGWRVDLALGAVSCAEVNHLLIVIDFVFPHSQPRIYAPQASRDYSWPHIESSGALCLPNTMITANPELRALDHLNKALVLLNFTEVERRVEFVQEFSKYWANSSQSKAKFSVLSLLEAKGPSRDIFWYEEISKRRLIVAENKPSLMNWLRHAGLDPSDKRIISGHLVWLKEPWIPVEFPELGRDVLKHLSDEAQKTILRPDEISLVMFGTETPNGAAFAAVTLKGSSVAKLTKGFRSLSAVPPDLIARTYASQPVNRLSVSRVDGAWIHGRDKNKQYLSLEQRKVALIGCGALGAAIARLLAQAGLGNFILVDDDVLAGHNTSRHVLGQRFLGKNKAGATAKMLQEDFPHIMGAVAFSRRFQDLNPAALQNLAECDVVISSGIDVEGDAALDQWRSSLAKPPIHVCTWVEHFALAGHAVALLTGAKIMDAFDTLEQIKFRLTDWPVAAGAISVEAGCGNAFQPHGAVELQATIGMAAGVTLDALSGKVSKSVRRVWQGDSNDVTQRGGIVLPTFDNKNCFAEHSWH